MVGLVRAEVRKIFTVNLWWALLIPVAVLSLGGGWLGTAIGTISELEQELGRPLPLGLLTVSVSTNFSTLFAGLFGALAVSGEHWNKSITTTYLTGNPRGAVLGAKLITYTAMGGVFGLINVLFASLGTMIGAGTDGFGDPLDWFSVCGAGLLAMVLWMLLGLGFGALVKNSVVAIIALLAYKLMFEFILSLLIAGSQASWLGAYLPGAAGNGIVGNIAVPTFVSSAAADHEPELPRDVFDVLHFFFGGSYGQPWWASVLTFAGYTVVFVLGGWLTTRRRDIT